jgi:hypothetical protein
MGLRTASSSFYQVDQGRPGPGAYSPRT